jgi:hypothetical protein
MTRRTSSDEPNGSFVLASDETSRSGQAGVGFGTDSDSAFVLFFDRLLPECGIVFSNMTTK